MSNPEQVTADEFTQAIHEWYPQIAEIVRLRLIVAKYRKQAQEPTTEDD